MQMCPARIENMYSTLARPEVQPDANRFRDRGCGNAKAAPGRRDSRRSGKFVGVVHIASTASDVSAVINYVDDRVADNDDTIAAHLDTDVATRARDHVEVRPKLKHFESVLSGCIDNEQQGGYNKQEPSGTIHRTRS